jgi:hypothetical protein
MTIGVIILGDAGAGTSSKLMAKSKGRNDGGG